MLGMGPQRRPGVLFECVGVPGVIQQMLEGAPLNARIVVVGVCMERDQIEPMFGINKELNVQFVNLDTVARSSPAPCTISPRNDPGCTADHGQGRGRRRRPGL